MANAAKIAALLRANGFTVLKVSEGDHDEDGEVDITENVSVQVPTYGSQCNVVRQVDKGTPGHGFVFGNPCRSHAVLMAAIRSAIVQEVLASVITKEGTPWSVIRDAVSAKVHVTNWLTEVRGPLQVMINGLEIARTPDVHTEVYVKKD